ncbi:MAG TPA: nucleotidyltransferase family protein [Candidatus Acidoferrales bacterium]|nr:nucleotidyltransferase family protein [Candidatus Acidoferrales bacterium]
MLAVVILGAGESRRMGQPKALLPFPENFAPRAAREPSDAGPKPAAAKSSQQHSTKTFLCHLIDVTRHPRAGLLRVVVGAHAEEIRARAKLDAEELVVNEEWQRGQLSSLRAAIRSLPAGATEGMLVCLVDHPLISERVIAQLMDAFDGAKNRVVIPTFRGRRGHPVIFSSALYSELLNAPEEIGARAVVRAHDGDVIEVAVEEEGVLLNLNEPESLRRIANPT